MDVLQKSKDGIDVYLSIDELIILNNALNEVCNALDSFDFETRMGVQRDRVTMLLSSIGSCIDIHEASKRL